MEINIVTKDKKQYLKLLLLGDEQESMIDRYIENGEMFALFDKDLKAISVVTDEGNGVFEIKNIATEPQYQRQGHGKRLIEFLFEHYKSRCTRMLVGTGDNESTIQFYLKCGFVESHHIKNFFTENYDHPIFEGGKQLIDMVYLQKTL